MNNPPDFIRQLDGQFEDGIIRSRKPVYHCTPIPSEKIGKGAVCREGGGGTVQRLVSDVYSISSSSVPCPVFLMIAKDCTERLSAVALSVGLIIPRG